MKTTTKDFEKFKGYCREWIERFGVLDYGFRFEHRNVPQSGYARVRSNAEERTAIVTLVADWGKDCAVSDELLNRTALHEILHVILSAMESIGGARFATRVEFDTVEEAAVTRLENGIYRLMERK